MFNAFYQFAEIVTLKFLIYMGTYLAWSIYWVPFDTQIVIIIKTSSLPYLFPPIFWRHFLNYIIYVTLEIEANVVINLIHNPSSCWGCIECQKMGQTHKHKYMRSKIITLLTQSDTKGFYHLYYRNQSVQIKRIRSDCRLS